MWKEYPSEIEGTYNTRKQQTWFYWVCSWELMKSATILTPPSTGLSGILLSVRTHYSQRTRIWKNINTISMQGEKFCQLHTETTKLTKLVYHNNICFSFNWFNRHIRACFISTSGIYYSMFWQSWGGILILTCRSVLLSSIPSLCQLRVILPTLKSFLFFAYSLFYILTINLWNKKDMSPR